MRIKEWFGWHFPEVARIIKDNTIYVKIVKLIEVNIFLYIKVFNFFLQILKSII